MTRTSGSLPRRPRRTSFAMSAERAEVIENACSWIRHKAQRSAVLELVLTREGARRAARAVERENIAEDRSARTRSKERKEDRRTTRQRGAECHPSRYVTLSCPVTQRVDRLERRRRSVHLDPGAASPQARRFFSVSHYLYCVQHVPSPFCA